MRKAVVIGLVGCAGSTAMIGWIRLVVRMQTPCLAAWFDGEDADPILLVEETNPSFSPS